MLIFQNSGAEGSRLLVLCKEMCLREPGFEFNQGHIFHLIDGFLLSAANDSQLLFFLHCLFMAFEREDKRHTIYPLHLPNLSCF